MKVTDPVCKMVIEDKDSAGTSTYKGTTYYFCSEMCKQDFDKNPESYLKVSAEEAKSSKRRDGQRPDMRDGRPERPLDKKGGWRKGILLLQ